MTSNSEQNGSSGSRERGVFAKGEKIRDLRILAGLTQEKLASTASCDPKTLRRAEHSERLDVESLARLAGALGVPLSDIVTGVSQDSEARSLAAIYRYMYAFNSREPDAVVQCFCEDGVIVVWADPGLPGTGEYRGHDGIRRWVETCFEAYLVDPVTPDRCRITAVGDRVYVCIERSPLKYQPNGNEIVLGSLLSEFEIRDGLIASIHIYPESGAFERMVFSQP